MHVVLQSLVGKPLTAYKDGKRAEIGTITHATYHKGGVHIQAEITDGDLDERLGKIERKNIKIGG